MAHACVGRAHPRRRARGARPRGGARPARRPRGAPRARRTSAGPGQRRRPSRPATRPARPRRPMRCRRPAPGRTTRAARRTRRASDRGTRGACTPAIMATRRAHGTGARVRVADRRPGRRAADPARRSRRIESAGAPGRQSMSRRPVQMPGQAKATAEHVSRAHVVRERPRGGRQRRHRPAGAPVSGGSGELDALDRPAPGSMAERQLQAGVGRLDLEERPRPGDHRERGALVAHARRPPGRARADRARVTSRGRPSNQSARTRTSTGSTRTIAISRLLSGALCELRSPGTGAVNACSISAGA